MRGEHYWRMRDGSVIAVADMGPGHLANSIALAARHRKVLMVCNRRGLDTLVYARGAPDGAALVAENAAEEFFNPSFTLRVETAEELWPHVAAMIKRLGKFGRVGANLLKEAREREKVALAARLAKHSRGRGRALTGRHFA